MFFKSPGKNAKSAFFHLPVESLSNNLIKPDLRETTSAFESCHRLLNSTQPVSNNGILKSPITRAIATENPHNRSFLT